MRRSISCIFAISSIFVALLLFSPIVGSAATYQGELTAGDPVSDFPDVYAPGCTARGWGETPYDLYTVNHPGGAFVAELKGIDSNSGTLFDPYLVLYQGNFSPGDICENYLMGNDDGGTGWDAAISTVLAPGRYVLVATSFGWGYTLDYGTYQLRVVAPEPVPTVSEWGIILMSVLMLAIGCFIYHRHNRKTHDGLHA